MWGPKKEAEVAPPALGEEAPRHHHHHEGRRPGAPGPPLVHWLPSIHKGVGGGFSGAAGLRAGSCCPVGALCGTARRLPFPGRAAGDPPLGSGHFPCRKPLLLPLGLGTHRAGPFLSLVLTRKHPSSTDIPLYRMGN